MKYVAALVIGLFAGAAAYFFLAADDNVKAGIVSAAALLFAAILTNYYAREREILARQFQAKRDAYEEIFDLVVDMLKSTKSGRSIPERELRQRAFSLKRGLMIWGSAPVVEQWNKIEKKVSSERPIETARLMEAMFRAVRKDLGHDDSHLRFGELTSLFVIAEDKEKIM